jgi:hypothetical protein
VEDFNPEQIDNGGNLKLSDSTGILYLFERGGLLFHKLKIFL